MCMWCTATRNLQRPELDWKKSYVFNSERDAKVFEADAVAAIVDPPLSFVHSVTAYGYDGQEQRITFSPENEERVESMIEAYKAGTSQLARLTVHVHLSMTPVPISASTSARALSKTGRTSAQVPLHSTSTALSATSPSPTALRQSQSQAHLHSSRTASHPYPKPTSPTSSADPLSSSYASSSSSSEPLPPPPAPTTIPSPPIILSTSAMNATFIYPRAVAEAGRETYMGAASGALSKPSDVWKVFNPALCRNEEMPRLLVLRDCVCVEAMEARAADSARQEPTGRVDHSAAAALKRGVFDIGAIDYRGHFDYSYSAWFVRPMPGVTAPSSSADAPVPLVSKTPPHTHAMPTTPTLSAVSSTASSPSRRKRQHDHREQDLDSSHPSAYRHDSAASSSNILEKPRGKRGYSPSLPPSRPPPHPSQRVRSGSRSPARDGRSKAAPRSRSPSRDREHDAVRLPSIRHMRTSEDLDLNDERGRRGTDAMEDVRYGDRDRPSTSDAGYSQSYRLRPLSDDFSHSSLPPHLRPSIPQTSPSSPSNQPTSTSHVHPLLEAQRRASLPHAHVPPRPATSAPVLDYPPPQPPPPPLRIQNPSQAPVPAPSRQPITQPAPSSRLLNNFGPRPMNIIPPPQSAFSISATSSVSTSAPTSVPVSPTPSASTTTSLYRGAVSPMMTSPPPSSMEDRDRHLPPITSLRARPRTAGAGGSSTVLLDHPLARASFGRPLSSAGPSTSTFQYNRLEERPGLWDAEDDEDVKPSLDQLVRKRSLDSSTRSRERASREAASAPVSSTHPPSAFSHRNFQASPTSPNPNPVSTSRPFSPTRATSTSTVGAGAAKRPELSLSRYGSEQSAVSSPPPPMLRTITTSTISNPTSLPASYADYPAHPLPLWPVLPSGEVQGSRGYASSSDRDRGSDTNRRGVGSWESTGRMRGSPHPRSPPVTVKQELTP